MIITETALPGVHVVEIEPIEDERGFFARSWSADVFASHGLESRLEHCDISFNGRRGTVRGMHMQVSPHEEVKLVRATTGRVLDVAVDLRLGSPTYRRWVAAELSAANRRALYIPAGCAHGYQTLDDDTEAFYQMTGEYDPGSARGFRWDDPAFGIDWPLPASVISPRDASYELLDRP